jgi:hypothetical protein
MDQMRRNPHERRALTNGASDAANIAMLKVPQPAMDYA